MAVLPTPGGNTNAWGTLLNTWLQVAHNADGTLINPGVAWVNVTSEAYGADPTGGTDSTMAIQAAMTALITLGGGVLYFPAGNYLQNGAVSWNSTTAPLMVIGDGPAASEIWLNNSTSSITYWTVTNAPRVAFWNISLNNNANSPAYADTNIAIQLTSCPGSASIQNVVMQLAAATHLINQCVVVTNCVSVDISACDLRSAVNCVSVLSNGSGPSTEIAVRGSTFTQTNGSGVSTAASILITGTSGGVHVTNVVFNSGDRGLLMTGGTGANPAFVWMYDAEINSMHINGCELDTGAQVWFDSCLISSSSCTNSVVFGSSFVGTAYFDQCTFQDAAQHTVVINGGSGYSFSSCVFGESSAGKTTANTYDQLNIGSGVGYVTIDNCHFGTDPLNGIGTTPPRSAVSISATATDVVLTGNVSAANTSYGTAALMDNSGQAVRQGNIGLGFPEIYTGSGGPVTGTTLVALTPAPSVPAYDAQNNVVYKITALGHGTTATGTAVNLNMRFSAFGVGFGSFVVQSNPAANTAFTWKYEGFLRVTSSTAAVVVDSFVWGSPNPTGVTTIHTGSTTTALTTSAQTIALDASWASTTGSPTITCDICTIERMTPMPLS